LFRLFVQKISWEHSGQTINGKTTIVICFIGCFKNILPLKIKNHTLNTKWRSTMSMWIYDDVLEEQGFQDLRLEVKRLEKEYLDLRAQLRDTETNLRLDPNNEYLKAKVKYLNKRLKHIEQKGPRLAADYPLEISLFGAPHG
jgi:hypothetical protein